MLLKLHYISHEASQKNLLVNGHLFQKSYPQVLMQAFC